MDNLYAILSENLAGDRALNLVECENTSITWEEVFSNASRLSANFKEAGLSAGSLIVIEIGSSIEFLIAIIAGIQSQLIIAPLSPDLSEKEFNLALRSLRPQVLLRRRQDKIISRHESVTSFVELDCRDLGSSFNFIILVDQEYNESNSDPRIKEIGKYGAFIRSTSGTTGQSKGVMISFARALERIRITKENYALRDDDFVLSVLPLPYHFVAALLSFVLAKSSLRIVGKISNEDFETNFYKQCSVIYAAPFHYDCLNGISSNEVFKNLRLALSTSVKLFESTYDNFLRKFGVKIAQSYGIIEVGIIAANIDVENPAFSYKSVGRPFKQFDVNLLEQINESQELNMGVLAVNGPGLFDCYIEPFKLSEEVFTAGMFVTGDRVEVVDCQMFIKGRSTAVINVAGFKVFPEEIEETLLALPSISESRVYGVAHEIFGNVLCADIVLSAGVNLVERDILTHCRSELAKHKIPRIINFVSKIKKNDANKIVRR